jgi:hypothetical protein
MATEDVTTLRRREEAIVDAQAVEEVEPKGVVDLARRWSQIPTLRLSSMSRVSASTSAA